MPCIVKIAQLFAEQKHGDDHEPVRIGVAGTDEDAAALFGIVKHRIDQGLQLDKLNKSAVHSLGNFCQVWDHCTCT